MSKQRALRIGVVGLGHCGGNIAARFAEQGYRVLAMNTSQTELRATDGLSEDQRLYVGAEGLNGTGGALAVGAESLAAREAEILRAVAPWSELDALVAVGGLGGGTGGNLGLVVALLADTNLPVIALAVLPASSESHTAKVNALQGLNELLDAPFVALWVVDNQRLHTTFAQAGIDGYLRAGNRALVEAFDDLNAVESTGDLTSLRRIDSPELLHTLLSGGAVVFGCRTLAHGLSAGALVDALRSVVTDHEVLGCGYEPGDAVVVSAVVVVGAQELTDAPATVLEELSAALGRETDGADVHLSLYRGDVSPGRVHLMVGGLPLPGRAQVLLEEAAAEAERFATRRAPRTTLQKLDLSGLDGAAGRGPFPPSTGGKGMAKISPPGARGADPVAPPEDPDSGTEAE